MIKKIENVGVAVKDLGKSEELFEKLLGKKPYNKEELTPDGISISFFKIGNQKIELLASSSNKSTIKKFFEKRKAYAKYGAKWLELSGFQAHFWSNMDGLDTTDMHISLVLNNFPKNPHLSR